MELARSVRPDVVPMDLQMPGGGGLSNPAIARELAISHKTVRNYVSSIFRKLQVADRSQAIVRARGRGPASSRVTHPGPG